MTVVIPTGPVPDTDAGADSDAGTDAARADAERALAERIVDATYRVIERTGDVDPTMRDILREAGISTPAFYRQFRSKDELLAVLFADGRRRIASTVERRLARARTGEDKVRAWVAAVLAQARDPEAASRTRPFMAHVDRLVERYPDEQRASEQLLIDQLVAVIEESDDLVSADPRADATAVYHLAFGALGWHLRYRSTPRPAEIDRVVDFACRALRPPGRTSTKHNNKGENHG
jgi:AcrR family transcriptional regulator